MNARAPHHRRFSRRKGFTLIEIMIVVAILGIVLSIAAFTWIQQRRRSQQRVCQENIMQIDGAKQQWALELNRPPGSTPAWSDLAAADGTLFLKRQPECPADGTYTIGSINATTACSVNAPLDHNAFP